MLIIFFMICRMVVGLEGELETEVARALQRVAQAVARSLFGIPILERREGEQVGARHVDAHELVGVADLGIFQTQHPAVAHVERVGLRVVGIPLGRQTRITGVGIGRLFAPVLVGHPLHQAAARRRLGAERMGVVHADRHLALSLEEGRAVEALG